MNGESQHLSQVLHQSGELITKKEESHWFNELISCMLLVRINQSIALFTPDFLQLWLLSI